MKNLTFYKNYCGYFKGNFGNNLATFHSNIWSHWIRIAH